MIIARSTFSAAILVSAISAALPGHGAEPQQTGMLQVNVSNVRSSRGHVHVAICPQALFLKDECIYKAIVPAKQGQTVAVVSGLPAGTYAAQVYFDENDNDTLDRTWIGIPEEGVGFSNNPSFMFRAPTFPETALRFDGMSGSIGVRLRYY
jgi:uncharacterized protein (DUF2141 family)